MENELADIERAIASLSENTQNRSPLDRIAFKMMHLALRLLRNQPANRAKRNKTGPKSNPAADAKVREIVSATQGYWALNPNCKKIAKKLDENNVPCPKRWNARFRSKHVGWAIAFEKDPQVVKKAIRNSLKRSKDGLFVTKDKL